MKLIAVLAALCVSVLANEKDTITTDLQGAVDSITNAMNTAFNMVSKTVTAKLNLKRSCWTRLANNVTTNSREVKNMNALKANLTSLRSKIYSDSNITPYVAQVLTDDNTPITQILNAGATLADNLNSVISNLDINASC